jgi:hypothetical protein
VSVDAPDPPLPTARVPLHPKVNDTALSNAVAGVPPNVQVIFVSSTSVNAAPVTSVPAIFAHDIVVPLVVRKRPELPVIKGGMPYPVVNARVSVPDETIGDPETENPVGADSATDVTVPLPAPDEG